MCMSAGDRSGMERVQAQQGRRCWVLDKPAHVCEAAHWLCISSSAGRRAAGARSGWGWGDIRGRRGGRGGAAQRQSGSSERQPFDPQDHATTRTPICLPIQGVRAKFGNAAVTLTRQWLLVPWRCEPLPHRLHPDSTLSSGSSQERVAQGSRDTPQKSPVPTLEVL